ncbi:MAG: thioether cross-link-forming SCIFF peptide maturase [Eubacteriales bacterium]
MLDLKGYNLRKNIHVYKQGDLIIAYDVNSTSIHLLDDNTFKLIKEMMDFQDECPASINRPELIFMNIGKNLSEEEKSEILSELEGMQKEDVLFSEEIEEISMIYPAQPQIKSICLHVAHDCNLRCKYCFADTGPFGGKRALMDFETGKRALDFVIENSGDRPHCEVDFFGGEPLMNFDVVKKLTAYGKKAGAAVGKKMKYTITTNAVLMNKEVQDFFEKEEISVVLSLDGRKEIHDLMRPYASGKGSYDNIIPNILDFVTRRPKTSRYAVGTYYYVRGTYTHYNTDFYKDVLHIADMGVKRISLEPVVAESNAPYAFTKEDIEKVKESYDILAEKVLEYDQTEKAFTFFHFNAALDGGPCLLKRLSGCGAGHEYAAISPEGDIYPCHQFVGQEEFKMGSLYDTPIKLKESIVDKFRKANIYSKDECNECWARFSCSGGCHASNYAYSGKLTKVYKTGCEFQRKRLEIAYYLKIKETQK